MEVPDLTVYNKGANVQFFYLRAYKRGKKSCENVKYYKELNKY